MTARRQFSLFDKLITNADQALRTLVPGAATAERASPAQSREYSELSEQERQHAAGAVQRVGRDVRRVTMEGREDGGRAFPCISRHSC